MPLKSLLAAGVWFRHSRLDADQVYGGMTAEYSLSDSAIRLTRGFGAAACRHFGELFLLQHFGGGVTTAGMKYGAAR